MAVDRAWYDGREQAFVKHSFLDRYLGRLFNKIASSRDTLVYVDGFAGPWKSASDRFEDTSFGIALNQLRGAKRQARRPVRAIAHLVEKDPKAFADLQKIVDRFPDIEIVPHSGDFHDALAGILDALPEEAFTFSLLDPKGWLIDVRRLAPLLARPNSEVVINLMYDFINRFIEHPDERIGETLNRTLPGPNWRAALRSASAHNPAAREAIITGTFSETLKEAGNFRYAPSLRVRRPGHERTLYHLVLATRSRSGLAVFRESQLKALEEESRIQSELKRDKREQKTGMFPLFPNDIEATFDPVAQFLQRERAGGREALLRLIGENPNGLQWATVWPAVLEQFALTQSALGKEANTLRKNGLIEILGWPSERKQIPEDSYILRALQAS